MGRSAEPATLLRRAQSRAHEVGRRVGLGQHLFLDGAGFAEQMALAHGDILELDVGMGQGHLFGEPRAIKEQVLAETDPPAEFLRSTLRSAEQRRRFS